LRLSQSNYLIRIVDKPNATPYIPKGGDITFKNVNFSYKNDKGTEVNILNNFNISIQKGKHTAIVGRSGFGKTTILNMMVNE
jgi:ABC-type bacteriocin/lantibiotic exporter with double-glycine peptidase domain